MAVRYVTRYVDDIDGTELATDDVQSIEFSLDGKDYSIDLGTTNAATFREAIDPYLNAATKVTSATRRNTARKTSGKASSGETKRIREWAQINGYTVSDRGRVAAEIVEAYRAAN